MFKPKIDKAALILGMERGDKARDLAVTRGKRRNIDPVRLLRMFRPFFPKPAGVAGIYFLQAGESGPVKIGMAGDIWKRVRALQLAHYEDLHIRGHIADWRWGNYAWAEQVLHARFVQHRIRGEWFSPAKEITSLWKGEQA